MTINQQILARLEATMQQLKREMETAGEALEGFSGRFQIRWLPGGEIEVADLTSGNRETLPAALRRKLRAEGQ